MARLSDAEWMSRYVQRTGTQRAVAAQLGVSPSMVSKIIKGERSGARYRDAARAGATGRKVTPPPPTSRTPRRVRQPVRRPGRDGRSRVVTQSPRVAAREVQRSRDAGRSLTGFTVTVTNAVRSGKYRHKNDQGWSGPLTVAHPTDDQLAALTQGTRDDVLRALRQDYPWLGRGRIAGITWED